MATAGDLWDITGKTTNPALPAGSKNTSTTGTTGGTSTTNTSQNSSKSFSSQNTPQFALNALQQLITSLSDRPGISLEEAAAQNPYASYVNGNPVNPITGEAMSPQQAKIFNNQQDVKRQEMVKNSGVVEGGTIETRRATADRQTEIARDREQQGKYSKEAAFSDATELQGRFTRQLLEQLMPNITKAADSSGTSGGVVGGLLAQDAAARTAEAQSALGLQTAAQYGQLYNQLANTLELLTRDASPTTKALLEAIGLSRGTISVGSESNAASGTSTTTDTKTVNQDEKSVQAGAPPLAPATPSNTVQQGGAVTPVNNTSPYMSIKVNNNSDSSYQQLLDALISPNDSGEYRF